MPAGRQPAQAPHSSSSARKLEFSGAGASVAFVAAGAGRMLVINIATIITIVTDIIIIVSGIGRIGEGEHFPRTAWARLGS